MARLFSIFVVTFLAACPPEAPPPPPAPTSTYDGFVEEFTKAICATPSCGAPAEDCVIWVRAAVREGIGARDGALHAARSVEWGRATYDPVRGSECLAAIAYACQGANLACARVTVAASQPTTACHRADDCASRSDGCYGAGCARVCRLGGGEAEGCRATAPACNAGLFCDRGVCRPEREVGSTCDGTQREDCGDLSVCAANRCTKLPRAGERCLLGRCEASASCRGGTCFAKGALGAACDAVPCQRGLRCLDGRCADSARDGEVCDAGADCTEGSVCLAGRCAMPATGGAACLRSEDCAEGYVCDELVGACLAETPVGTGAPCSSAKRCLLPEVCRFPGDVNAARTCGVSVAGDRCPSPDACSEGFHCVQGVCGPSTVGSPCTLSRECQSTDFCAGSVCARRAALGAPCARGDGACLEGLCAISADGLRCQVVPSAGAPCLEGQCSGRAVCFDGGCVTSGRPHQPCSDFMPRCLEGECLSADGGLAELREPGRCTELRADGALCRFDQGCRSGVCERRAAVDSSWFGVCVSVCR